MAFARGKKFKPNSRAPRQLTTVELARNVPLPTPTSINNILPFEIIEHIVGNASPSDAKQLSYEHRRFLCEMALVCTSWRIVAQRELWRTLSLGGRALARFAAGAIHVDHPTLTLSICLTPRSPSTTPDPDAQFVLGTVRGVRVLTLLDGPLDPSILTSPNLKDLKSLRVQPDQSTPWVGSLELPFQLDSLHLLYTSPIPQEQFLNIFSQQSSLTSLTFDLPEGPVAYHTPRPIHPPRHPVEDLRCLHPLASGLRTLDLCTPGNVDDFLQRCTQLKDLVTRRVDLNYISRLPGWIETWTVEAVTDGSIAPMLDLIRTTTKLRRLSLFVPSWVCCGGLECFRIPVNLEARSNLKKMCSEMDIELVVGEVPVVVRKFESD